MAKIKDDTSKNKVLKSATKLFVEQGVDGTNIRQIYKDANANVCMISYHWGKN